MWGIFENKYTEVHILSCNEKGFFNREDHVLDEVCICEPLVKGNMVIHRVWQ